ncbi:serine hydrolase domain-containing protein [Aspergillus lucknowensis]|uniref:Beta-lactamase/transpeptidase-like protein n=1 Tax=Aspergillus lucknowensis TaxID=176173 RepID=A0ABR4LE37_9EURO
MSHGMHFISLVALFYGAFALASSICPPTGPVLPPPHIPRNASWSGITDVLNAFVQDSEGDGWNASINSFSVVATSAEDTFFRYHYTAPLKDEMGVKTVDDDTVYSVASITKVFTVLAVLLEDRLDLDAPIGKYVKELDTLEWKDVTLRLLTTQTAAIPRDGYMFDHAPDASELMELGFPGLRPSDIPPCGLSPGSRMCSREELFDSFSEFNFTGVIGDRVAYSDLAYILLGYALEDVTGLPYEQVLQKSIFEPLGLKDTSGPPPDGSRMIVPIDSASWVGVDWAYFSKTAGLYSTPNDLSVFIRAILNNVLLSRVRTNEWLKPAAFTSQLDNSVGAPWEIFRPTTLTNGSRPIDHYTKSGDVPGFSSSYLVLVPEYNVGVSILGAGPDASTFVPLLLDTVQAALIPMLEEMARMQAAKEYTGQYEWKAGNESSVISLGVDDGPGLKVSGWTKGAIDMLKSFDVAMFGSISEDAVPPDVRLYPIGADDRWYVDFTEQDKGPSSQRKKPGALRGSACMPWYRVDGFHYGKVRIDEVMFRRGEEGVVEGVEVPVLRESFQRVR